MKAGTHAESRQVERVALFLALVYKCGGDGGAVISSGSAVYLRLANAGTCVAQAVRSRSAHVHSQQILGADGVRTADTAGAGGLPLSERRREATIGVSQCLVVAA